VTVQPPPVTAVTPVTPATPVVNVRPKVPMPVTGPARPEGGGVVTLPKTTRLEMFKLEAPFNVKLKGDFPLAGHTVAGSSCGPTPGQLHVIKMGAAPGPTAASVEFTTGLTEGSGPEGCTNVFVELLDQHGDRVMATLLTDPHAVEGTTAWKETSMDLPQRGHVFQLRFGPQSRPLATYEIDLAKQTVTPR
jgi:hypothetical protein